MERARSLQLELTGRGEVLERLVDVARHAERKAVVIAGEAGVGKSRLAEELVSRLEAAGWSVVRARATHAGSDVPFGAFAHYLPQDLSAVMNPLDVFRHVVDAVMFQPAPAGRVVLVDDAHLLDELSAALVRHVVSRAFVVVTLRTSVPVPGDVTALWKDELADRVDLQPLSQHQTSQLFESAVGGPIDEVTARRLWGWTGGNPLFVREVLLTGLEMGALVQRAGTWRWSGCLTISARLAELVQSRLAGLPTPVIELLELLAVGEPLPEDLLGAHRSVLDVAEAGQLVLPRGSRNEPVRLTHPLYGEVVRASLTPSRSLRVHAELARRLEASGPTHPGDIMRLALWSLLAGRIPTEPRLLVTASQQALAAGDHALAIRLANHATDVGAGAEGVLASAEASYWAGDHHTTIRELAEVDWSTQRPELHARAAILRASAAFWGLGDGADADQVLVDAEAHLAAEPSGLEVLAHHASLSFFSGRPDEALRLGHAVLTDRNAGPVARLRAQPAMVAAWALKGQLSRAQEMFDAALPDALSHLHELPELAGELALGRCLADALAGELDRADELATAVYDEAVVERGNEFVGSWALFRGLIALNRGTSGAARRWLREAVAGLELHDPAALLSWAHALTAEVAALAGDSSTARRALRDAEATRSRAVAVYSSELIAAEAWTLRAEGRLPAARAAMRCAAAEAQSSGLSVTAARRWHDLVRLGAHDDALRPLAELAPTLQGPLPPAYLVHARAVGGGDAKALDAASALFSTCRANLLAAEASAAAAAGHAKHGRRSAELASRARCAALRADDEPAITVGSCEQSLALDRLTARERDVLELAARGLSNREIATELYLSIRTVGNHLAHVYSKLAVPGRASLGAVASLGADWSSSSTPGTRAHRR